jgi:arylsulfatase A-like enzyme
MKNVIVIHLESLSNQTMATFRDAFPTLERFSDHCLRFNRFFASATSSLMALACLWHGNSFELDHGHALNGVRPSGLNRNLYAILHDHGYHVNAFCFNLTHPSGETDISIWPKELGPAWGTDNGNDLLSHFDRVTDKEPFGLYFWNLLTHISNNNEETRNRGSLSRQQRKKYELTDALLSKLLEMLERKNLMAETVILFFGDHGDDFWTHGFKSGYVHALEPYTTVVATPLLIYSSDVAPGNCHDLAGTVDVRNTVLGMLGIPHDNDHPCSGIDLFREKNDVVFSQSLMANQAYADVFQVYKSYAAINDTHILLVTKEGLEFYDHVLDPSNGCNLLHFFKQRGPGEFVFGYSGNMSDHMGNIYGENRGNLDHMRNSLRGLRDALRSFVATKNTFATDFRFDMKSLDRINRTGWEDFYRHRDGKYRKECFMRRLQLWKEKWMEKAGS